MPKKIVKTTLVQDKTCKNVVRYRGEADDKVTTALYLGNESFKALGNPKEIEVEISAK